MYIGSTDERGLHHLVYEIVDNAIDEAMAGVCDTIGVTIEEDNTICVTDNGRGIPTGIHPKLGRPAVEVCLTVLHAGGKFGGGGYKVSGGLHGVGLSVVNALSEWLEVTVYQNGSIYRQEYTRGVPQYDLKIIGQTDRHGTTVRFRPDAEIFDDVTAYSFDTLKKRLRELAFLNAGIRIELTDKRGEGQDQVFHYEGGIRSFIEYLNKNREVLFPEPLFFSGVKDGTAVEVSMQYNDSYTENVFSFANNIDTVEGGTHLEGFRRALTRVINDYGRKAKILKDSDANLTGDDIREGLTAVVSVKLVDPQFEGQTKTKLGNSEAMITAFGAGVGDDFNPEKLRYHRIVCMTDADVDGSHIRILLLTFFYRYMRPLIDGGYVYVAQPPLFKIVKNKKEHYVYSDEELAAYLDEIGRGNDVTVQRYKGLGEMSA